MELSEVSVFEISMNIASDDNGIKMLIIILTTSIFLKLQYIYSRYVPTEDCKTNLKYIKPKIDI